MLYNTSNVSINVTMNLNLRLTETTLWTALKILFGESTRFNIDDIILLCFVNTILHSESIKNNKYIYVNQLIVINLENVVDKF